MSEVIVDELDHVQIAAPRGCERDARAFFGDLLGLKEIQKPESLQPRGGCWFKVGSRQLHIGVEDGMVPLKKAHAAFAVRHVESLFRRLEDAGVPCKWDDTIPTVRRFYAEDPWGNRMEFTEPTCSN